MGAVSADLQARGLDSPAGTDEIPAHNTYVPLATTGLDEPCSNGGIHVTQTQEQKENSMRRTLESLLVLSLLLAASPSFAQTFGQITGRVLDSSGAVLPGATITVTNPQTGIAATEQANTAGVYVFPNLLPGT
jgi:hypothetical protein